MRGYLKLAIIFIPYYISLKMIVVKENIEKKIKNRLFIHLLFEKKKNIFIKNTFFLIYIASPHPDCIPV